MSSLDQRRPPRAPEDREVAGESERLLLRRGPETRLPADGEGLLPQIPALGRLPEPEAQIQDSVVHLALAGKLLSTLKHPKTARLV